MPIRYTNLSSNVTIQVVAKPIIYYDGGCSFLCVKVSFSNTSSINKIGRTYLKALFSPTNYFSTIDLYKLKTLDILSIDEFNIISNLDTHIARINEENHNSIFEKNIDITQIIEEQTSLSFDISFAIMCSSYEDEIINININNPSTYEVLICECFKNSEENTGEYLIQDVGSVGQGYVNLYNQELDFVFLDIMTSSNNPVFLQMVYSQEKDGIFGFHTSANFEYQMNKTNDYIEIINYKGISSYYFTSTKEDAKEKYGIDII